MKQVLPSAGVTIRQMTEDDIAAVFKIERTVFPIPFEVEKMGEMRRWFPQGCFVACYDGPIVGFLMSLLRKSQLGHIVSVAVAPEHQGKGIGTALVIEAMNLLRSYGASGIKLEVNVDNRNAISLYKGLGFIIEQKIPEYYLDGSDAYVMFYQELIDHAS